MRKSIEAQRDATRGARGRNEGNIEKRFVCPQCTVGDPHVSRVVIELKSVLMCAAAKVSARYMHENAFDSSADLKIPQHDVSLLQHQHATWNYLSCCHRADNLRINKLINYSKNQLTEINVRKFARCSGCVGK